MDERVMSFPWPEEAWAVNKALPRTPSFAPQLGREAVERHWLVLTADKRPFSAHEMAAESRADRGAFYRQRSLGQREIAASAPARAGDSESATILSG
jgi:hypothetical protein